MRDRRTSAGPYSAATTFPDGTLPSASENGLFRMHQEGEKPPSSSSPIDIGNGRYQFAGRVQEGGDPPMFFLNILPPPCQLSVAVIGRRVGQGGEGIDFRPIAGRLPDPIEVRR